MLPVSPGMQGDRPGAAYATRDCTHLIAIPTRALLVRVAHPNIADFEVVAATAFSALGYSVLRIWAVTIATGLEEVYVFCPVFVKPFALFWRENCSPPTNAPSFCLRPFFFLLGQFARPHNGNSLLRNESKLDVSATMVHGRQTKNRRGCSVASDGCR